MGSELVELARRLVAHERWPHPVPRFLTGIMTRAPAGLAWAGDNHGTWTLDLTDDGTGGILLAMLIATLRADPALWESWTNHGAICSEFDGRWEIDNVPYHCEGRIYLTAHYNEHLAAACAAALLDAWGGDDG